MSTIVAGIDECGYGPLLGPLVVSTSIFSIDDNSDDNLWIRLQKSVAKVKKSLNGRLLVADSKKAYKSNYHPRSKTKINHLERTVMAFLNQEDGIGSMGMKYFIMSESSRFPWYANILKKENPTLDEVASLYLISNMIEQKIYFLCFNSIILGTTRYNELVKSTGNKATAVTDSVLKLIHFIIEITQNRGDNKIIIYCDRLGGRKHYADLLNTIPHFEVIDRWESNKLSQYKMISYDVYNFQPENIEIEIQFEVKADDKQLPVALASMMAKYTRETIMQCMNDYFINLQPGLKPTSGYWVDGWRWIEEVTDKTYKKAGLRMADIVRIK